LKPEPHNDADPCGSSHYNDADPCGSSSATLLEKLYFSFLDPDPEQDDAVCGKLSMIFFNFFLVHGEQFCFMLLPHVP
jgi:hypothetical protein